MTDATAERLTRPRVVILGGGFGGLYAAQALRHSEVEVVLVDRTNHHLFQPLLYQVATATLAPTDIVAPLRWLVRKQSNTDVVFGEVRAVDSAGKQVHLTDGRTIPYNYAILALGARHSYFGHPQWEAVAPGLKSIDDAIEIRRRFLLAFERADAATTPDERDEWLTMVVIGAGPTGVELAGMLPTVARRALPRDFHHIDTAKTRVILLEGGPRILPTFPADLAERARTDLEHLGVEVRVNARVTGVADGRVDIGAERIRAHTILWAAGNEASPIARTLGTPLDAVGRVLVEPDLSVPGHPELFVVGDLAVMTTDGKPVPGVAPAAMQSGRSAAANILRTVRRQSRRPFGYRNKGDLATIGRYRAIAVIGGVELSGPFAWWTWLFVHILYLAGFRNRLSVLVQWGYSFFTYERGARLIQHARGSTPDYPISEGSARSNAPPNRPSAP
ncbi:MAG TPA: NAD(P)/FAD-dependent oxidoreductase [Gemmatimonadaceae bacterium]|nr:NAD(P)/FAD-dependent oxidoreductase [Gemmatimonadaceae bacterium]